MVRPGGRDVSALLRLRSTDAATRTSEEVSVDDHHGDRFAQRREERIRLGVEEAPPEDGGGTVHALLEWWIDAYLSKSPGYSRAVGTIRKHLIGSKLGRLRLVELTAGKIEAFLQAKVEDCAPQTLNHLRGYLSRAFNAGRKTERFRGPNPVADVRKRRIPKTVPDFLRAEEVPLVLAALSDRWRSLFATALFTGLRAPVCFWIYGRGHRDHRERLRLVRSQRPRGHQGRDSSGLLNG